MALRFLDSFDHYTTLTQKWTLGSNATNTAAAARTGTYGLRITANGGDELVSLTLNAQGTWIVGVAYRRPSLPSDTIISTLDVGAVQGLLRQNADGTLSLLVGAGVVATSVNAILTNVFYYIEFKHIILNAGGTLEVRVDGVVWATFNGDTQATANAFANVIRLGAVSGSGVKDFDDLYILDGVDQSIADPNSPPNNDYWGNTQIQCIVPTAPGNYAEWTTLVGAPTHWQAEDEVPPDEDASYVESAVVDQRDTYNFGDLAVVSATIPGIQILMRARTTLAGVANIARLYRRAAADSQGADVVLQTSYNYHREILGGDPIAAGAWAVANLNAAEFGARVR